MTQFASSFFNTTGTAPEATWEWSSEATDTGIIVTCIYGGGSAAIVPTSARIDKGTGNTASAPIKGENQLIYVNGTVTAFWSGDSYVVTFTGAMNYADHINNISPANTGKLPFIVAASL